MIRSMFVTLTYVDAGCCKVLQGLAGSCRVSQGVAGFCRVLQCVVVCCSVLQCVAGWCRVLQGVAGCCSVLQYVSVYSSMFLTLTYGICCRVLQCVAVCCSVLQCVAVCCSVLPCRALSIGACVVSLIGGHMITSRTYCNILKRMAPNQRHYTRANTKCTTLQQTATYCNSLQHTMCAAHTTRAAKQKFGALTLSAQPMIRSMFVTRSLFDTTNISVLVTLTCSPSRCSV